MDLSCALAYERTKLLASTSTYFFHGELLLFLAHYITLLDTWLLSKASEVICSGLHFYLVKCNLESPTYLLPLVRLNVKRLPRQQQRLAKKQVSRAP